MLHRKNKINAKINIKAFFQGDKWREAFIFLFFLLFSAGFWLMQTLQETAEGIFSVPVSYSNVPENIAFNESLPNEIELRVQDRGVTILNYKFGSKLDSLRFDLGTLKPQNNTYTIPAKYIESECQRILSHETKLLSCQPNIIVLDYNRLTNRKIPVFLQGDIEPAAGFMLTGEVHFDPSVVTVFGSKEILDTLQGIYTKEIKLLNVDKSGNIQVKIDPANGLKTNISSVKLSYSVEEYTEKVFEIPIIAKNFPENFRLRTFPAVVQVSCLLPLSLYASVNPSDFEASVYYADVKKDTTSTVRVEISRKPEFLKKYRFSPEKVEYLLEQVQSND